MECGSPPRMRGKPLRTPHLCKSVRITPAHAGKTALYCASSMSASDHPRACGENWKRALTLSATSGSPPRMRGKRKEVSHGRKGIRITPAHAGKTRTFASSPLSQPDHPRACGENARKLFRERLGLGSPPRMRGKRLCPPCVVGFARITPAHAGKTEGHVRRSGGNADHPRACGENPKTFAASGTVIGSPPRMRGKRLQPGRRELRVRITPAHAGKTPLRARPATP